MKRIFYSVCSLALALAVVGCQKSLPSSGDVNSIPAVKGEPTTVAFSLRSTTKATEDGTLNENKVNRVDAFVFNADGTLDGYLKVDSPADIDKAAEVKATTGKGKRFVVLVNAATAGDPNLTDDLMEDVDHINDLNNVARTFYLRNNTLGGFQMYGATKQDLVSGENTVVVPINRAVSRIKIDKITRQFDVPSLADQNFSIKKIYISNVVGTVCNVADALDASNDLKYFQTIKAGASDIWFNKYAYEDSHLPYPGYVDLTADVNVKSLTQKDVDKALAQGANDEPANGYRFYVMPNDVMPAYVGGEDDAACLLKEQELQGLNPWAPTLTKLVIETELAGKTYYYSIPIVHRSTYPEGKISSGIGYNETFNFKNIVLTRAGSEDPDVPVSTSSVIFDLDIQPWTVQAMATDGDDFII